MSDALITELIEEPDNVERLRDSIAALLSLELQNQYELAVEKGVDHAGDYNPSIFVENTRPYDNPDGLILSLINILLPREVFSVSNPRTGNQKGKATFFIDCAANGNAVGKFRDDKSSAFRVWKLARIVRRIIMSAQYTYLGMRKVVGSRVITALEAGTPGNQGEAALAFTVVRMTMEVEYLERSIDSPSVILEGIDFDVIPETGEVKAKRSLKDRVTGINNEEEQDVTSVGD